MSHYDRFQLVILALVLVVFVGRSLQLRSRGVRVFVIGRGKRGLARALELAFFVGFPIWITELVYGAVTGGGSLWPGAVGERLFAHPPVRMLGALLCTFALALVLGIHRQILEEERFLASRYGEGYRQYVGRVRRYV
jgi:protein-S-isoprenylcysteine O-methyltransferase Ste14